MTAVLFIWPTYHSASRKCKERVVLAPSSLRQTSRAATCRLFCCILTMLFGFAAGQNARASNGANADGTQPVYETYFNPLAWFGSYTPCTYPSPWDRDFKRRCFISERAHEQHNMCNLDGAVSNTESKCFGNACYIILHRPKGFHKHWVRAICRLPAPGGRPQGLISAFK